MTDEQRKKIRWLGRALHAEKLTKALVSKWGRDRALAQLLARIYDGTDDDGDAADACRQLAETEEKLQAQLSALVQIRKEINAAITAVEDPELQAILLRRYLGYESIEQIAEGMHYSVRTVKYKHKQALDQVCIVLHFGMCYTENIAAKRLCGWRSFAVTAAMHQSK